MNMRRVKPAESLTEKLLSTQTSHAAEYERGIDNLVRGLVDLLPKPAGIWSLDDRAKWLRLAAGIFDLGYKACDGEQRAEISIAVVKQEAANRPTIPSTARTTAREQTNPD
jgi:hypothetical protein